MALLSAMALPSSDQGRVSLTRRMALGAGFGLAALAFATTGVSAQVVKTAGPGQPTASLAKHCDDIKDVFQLAKFAGEYKKQADAFVASGCVGTAPVPNRGDTYNTRRFSTSAGILQNGGGIVISPN